MFSDHNQVNRTQEATRKTQLEQFSRLLCKKGLKMSHNLAFALSLSLSLYVFFVFISVSRCSESDHELKDTTMGRVYRFSVCEFKTTYIDFRAPGVPVNVGIDLV